MGKQKDIKTGKLRARDWEKVLERERVLESEREREVPIVGNILVTL